jgi:heat shock protein HslJ
MTVSNCSKCGFVISILILVGLLASCGTPATSVSEAVNPDLTRSDWMLVSINDKPVASDSMALFAFGEAGNVLGSTGCNLFSGTYAIGTGDVLNFKPNVTTSFDCPEPYLTQEKSMLLVLSSSSNYILEGDELEITNPDGERRAVFSRMEPLELAGTNWILDAYNDGQGAFVNLIAGTEITASFSTDDQLSGSAGCNDYSTSYQVDGRQINFNPIIVTQMACAEPEGVMDQENKYLQALELVGTYRNFGIILVFYDQQGQIAANYFNADLQRNP